MTNAHGIKKLNDYQHLRLRTEMYFSSRNLHTQTIIQYPDGLPKPQEMSWVPALYVSFREVLDNALDEVIGHGHGNAITITFNETTLETIISDNGRGIPIDWDATHGVHLATLVMSEVRAGRNFSDRQTDTVGVNGIGASGVNYCSEYFTMEIHRDGKKFFQKFHEGKETDTELQITAPVIKEVKAGKTGTTITFKPSHRVFSDMTLPEDFIRSRIYEIAIANPKITFTFNGEKIKVKPKVEANLFEDAKPITIEINDGDFRSRFYIMPDWIQEGDHSHTLVNNIPAFNGGVHMEVFRRVFYGNLLSALEKESKKRKLTPNRSDVLEGTLLYNITNMTAPNFDSQSKTRLINEEVAAKVKKALEDEDLYREIIRKNREWIDAIYQRCAERTMKKDAQDVAKAARKLLRTKVPNLMAATGKDRRKCVLVLAEGLSAISGMASVRDPDIHGGLGLRGKVLNVHGESPKTVLENSVLADIMNSVGLIIGEKANRNALQYGKVYIAADADPDGMNITALLINFFHTFWPELFDPAQEPFLYVFMTPFIIAEKGKERKYWYSDNYLDMNPSDYRGWKITRAKGLGTLTEEDWRHSIEKPVLYGVVDDGKMKESLDLIFNGKKADERKAWLALD